ncbi:hypothetical protein [Methylosinus sp. Sm6]|uniref:hypothetical protein n=1 Tax=Methylosinus sp. Sm6 TaxID=2866948 RepID=UPI001C99D22B|nr:hypothetical protein [Methylosinus sp. Sm6]MBY6240058.1 hypothetical protein [Methylosinus sp. Sm6]
MAVDSTGRLAPRLLQRLPQRRFLFAGEAFEGCRASKGADLLHRQQEAMREALPDGGLLLSALGGDREADAETRRENLDRMRLAQRRIVGRRRRQGLPAPGPGS